MIETAMEALPLQIIYLLSKGGLNLVLNMY